MAAIQEIEASYGEKTGRIVQGWYETQDEIEPVEGPHADLFTTKQRARAAHTQMGERRRTLRTTARSTGTLAISSSPTTS